MRQVDGSNAMVKITTIPCGTTQPPVDGPSRSVTTTRCRPTSRRRPSNDKLPDVGVIAQGYTLEVSGENHWLQADELDRRTTSGTFKELHFDLEPNVWYTLKLRAANEDGKALLQGKVWKRGEQEPADWTIELIDPVPNTHGAPGMFGNATNAELYHRQRAA